MHGLRYFVVAALANEHRNHLEERSQNSIEWPSTMETPPDLGRCSQEWEYERMHRGRPAASKHGAPTQEVERSQTSAVGAGVTHKLTRTHTACQRPGWASHATAWPRGRMQQGGPHTVTKLHVLPLAPTQRPLGKGKDEEKGREL